MLVLVYKLVEFLFKCKGACSMDIDKALQSFSQYERSKCLSVKIINLFAYQCLDKVNMYKYANFDLNIPCGSRVTNICPNYHDVRNYPTLLKQVFLQRVKQCRSWSAAAPQKAVDLDPHSFQNRIDLGSRWLR